MVEIDIPCLFQLFVGGMSVSCQRKQFMHKGPCSYEWPELKATITWYPKQEARTAGLRKMKGESAAPKVAE